MLRIKLNGFIQNGELQEGALTSFITSQSAFNNSVSYRSAAEIFFRNLDPDQKWASIKAAAEGRAVFLSLGLDATSLRSASDDADHLYGEGYCITLEGRNEDKKAPPESDQDNYEFFEQVKKSTDQVLSFSLLKMSARLYAQIPDLNLQYSILLAEAAGRLGRGQPDPLLYKKDHNHQWQRVAVKYPSDVQEFLNKTFSTEILHQDVDFVRAVHLLSNDFQQNSIRYGVPDTRPMEVVWSDLLRLSENIAWPSLKGEPLYFTTGRFDNLPASLRKRLGSKTYSGWVVHNSLEESDILKATFTSEDIPTGKPRD